MPEDERRTAAIRKLNDEFRKTGIGGKVCVTRGVNALPQELQRELCSKVRLYDTFDSENDPYGEHDFAAVSVDGKKAYFKIDYYNSDLTAGSEDPSDAAATTRVMTIMLAHEY